MILAFSDTILDGKRAAGWRRGFAQQSQTTFADEFADDIVLEASTLVKPIKGKERVAATLAAATPSSPATPAGTNTASAKYWNR